MRERARRHRRIAEAATVVGDDVRPSGEQRHDAMPSAAVRHTGMEKDDARAVPRPAFGDGRAAGQCELDPFAGAGLDGRVRPAQRPTPRVVLLSRA